MASAVGNYFFAEFGDFFRMSTVDASLIELCQRCRCIAKKDVQIKVNPQEAVITFYGDQVAKGMDPCFKHSTHH